MQKHQADLLTSKHNWMSNCDRNTKITESSSLLVRWVIILLTETEKLREYHILVKEKDNFITVIN